MLNRTVRRLVRTRHDASGLSAPPGIPSGILTYAIDYPSEMRCMRVSHTCTLLLVVCFCLFFMRATWRTCLMPKITPPPPRRYPLRLSLSAARAASATSGTREISTG